MDPAWCQGNNLALRSALGYVARVAIIEAIKVKVRQEALPAPFDILTFAGGGGDLEIGATRALPAFTASYNRPPTAASLSDNDGNPVQDVTGSPTAFSSVNSYAKTAPNASVQFTLDANDVIGADQQNLNVFWRARRFVGWTLDPGPYDEAKILALNEFTNPLDANALFDLNLSPDNAPGGAYLVAAYHDDFNGAVPLDFEIGNFGNGDVSEVQTGVVMAIPGGTALYSVARSDFAVQAPGGIRFARES